MAFVYVREDVRVSVVRPDASEFRVLLKPGDKYLADDPIVREYGWAFERPVEVATAVPGEKRNVRRVG